MFKSATIKLTGWYLLILMVISLLFSIAIYNIATIELGTRLEQLQSRFELNQSPTVIRQFIDAEHDPRFNTLRAEQANRANRNLFEALFYVNILILVTGGAGSYFLARRTLGPIEEAHEAQSRFTSDASHELRTPLAVMKTELEVALRNKNLSTVETRELLESNLEEVNNLSNLASTLLQLSRLDHESLDREKLSLTAITRTIVKKYDKTGQRITYTPSSKDPLIYGNQASIEELVTILVDNALKYSPADSLITIKTTRSNRNARFEITNTGKGISPEDLPHIFDRFYRADTSRTKGGSKTGHGLGLSLAKKIIELHSGELSATSAPNHATTFTFSLPIFNKTQANSK